MSYNVLIDVVETTVFARSGEAVESAIANCRSPTAFDELIRPDVLINSAATHVVGISMKTSRLAAVETKYMAISAACLRNFHLSFSAQPSTSGH